MVDKGIPLAARNDMLGRLPPLMGMSCTYSDLPAIPPCCLDLVQGFIRRLVGTRECCCRRGKARGAYAERHAFFIRVSWVRVSRRIERRLKRFALLCQYAIGRAR